MQTNKNDTDDFEYLAQQGFEKVAVTASDFADLKKRMGVKRFSFSRFYLFVGSLLAGIVLGAALFFVFYSKPNNNKSVEDVTALHKPKVSLTETEGKVIVLDTVSIVNENFINPSKIQGKTSHLPERESVNHIDSVDVIASKPLDLSILTSGVLKEEKLKYMINSPVFYLHDLKITNYTTLYFKKNRFVKSSGLSAAYSNTNETLPAGSTLKQNADYYLHEEIAQALLYFKKGKYDQAIASLEIVAAYNPNDVNCDFYLGMSYYYKKKYSRAIELFDKCIINNNNTFLQEATYYKAVSFYESGHKDEGKTLFRKIALEEEFYAEKAKKYLAE